MEAFFPFPSPHGITLIGPEEGWHHLLQGVASATLTPFGGRWNGPVLGSWFHHGTMCVLPLREIDIGILIHAILSPDRRACSLNYPLLNLLFPILLACVSIFLYATTPFFLSMRSQANRRFCKYSLSRENPCWFSLEGLIPWILVWLPLPFNHFVVNFPIMFHFKPNFEYFPMISISL